MKKLLLLFGLSLLVLQSNGQNTGPITVIDGKYYQDDVRLGYGTIKSIVIDVPSAFQEVKKGKARTTWSAILGGFGGSALVTSLADVAMGTTMFSSDPTTGIFVGAAFIVAGVWLKINGTKKVSTGVKLYNSTFSSGYIPKGVNLNIGLANHGLGLTVTF